MQKSQPVLVLVTRVWDSRSIHPITLMIWTEGMSSHLVDAIINAETGGDALACLATCRHGYLT